MVIAWFYGMIGPILCVCASSLGAQKRGMCNVFVVLCRNLFVGCILRTGMN